VSTWLKEAAPPEEYILIVDSDMLFRRPLLPGPLGVQLGTAASQNQWCAPRSGTLPSACRRAGPPKPLRRGPAPPPPPPPRPPPPPPLSALEHARCWNQAHEVDLAPRQKGVNHGWHTAEGKCGAAPGTCRT